jgi:hypothetical protein
MEPTHFCLLKLSVLQGSSANFTKNIITLNYSFIFRHSILLQFVSFSFHFNPLYM